MLSVGLIVIAVSLLHAQECGRFLAEGDRSASTFQTAQTLEMYKKAFEECPDSYEALAKLTSAYVDRGEDLGVGEDARRMYRTAMNHANALIEHFPDSSMGYFFKALIGANLANQVGNREKVELSQSIERCARTAIRLDPDFAPSYIVLGAYYREASGVSGFVKGMAGLFYGEIPEASLEDSHRLLKKSLSIDPTNIYAHFEMAKTCNKMEQKDQAVTLLQRILELPVTDHRHPEVQAKARKLLREIKSS